MREAHLVITSTTANGSRFRPSDWPERLSSTLASFLVDNRLRYCHAVQPCVIDGEACLVVARSLETTDRLAFDYVMDFARSNRLRIQTDRRSGARALAAGPQAAVFGPRA